MGPWCQDEFCIATKTTVSLFSGKTVFLANTNFNITVDIARTFTTTEALTSIRCGFNNGAMVTYYPVFRITSTRYVCTITSMTPQIMNIGMYIGTTVITSNTVTLTAVATAYGYTFCVTNIF